MRFDAGSATSTSGGIVGIDPLPSGEDGIVEDDDDDAIGIVLNDGLEDLDIYDAVPDGDVTSGGHLTNTEIAPADGVRQRNPSSSACPEGTMLASSLFEELRCYDEEKAKADINSSWLTVAEARWKGFTNYWAYTKSIQIARYPTPLIRPM